MSARHPKSIRWQQTRPLALVTGFGALLIVASLSLQAPPRAYDSAPVAAWFVLYLAARFLTVPLFGGELNFSHTILLAAYIAFDLTMTLWLALAGVFVDQILRNIVQMWRRPAVGLRQASIEVGAALTRTLFSLVLASLAYKAVGGRLSSAAIVPSLVSLVVLCGTYGLSVIAIHSALAVFPLPVSDWARRNRRHLFLLVSLIMPLPFSVVIAVQYLRNDFGLFVAFAAALIVLMALFYGLGMRQVSLNKRRRELESISAVGQAIVNSLDMPELLQALREHVNALMDARNFYVALTDEDSDELAFPIVYENGQPVRYRSRAVSNGLTEYVLRTRQPLLIASDMDKTIKQLGLDVISGEQARCWLGVPIAIGERVLGVIAVQNPTHTHVYDLNDADLLRTIASQIAVAIENAQLHASSRRRATELAILNSVSTAVGSLLKLDQVMDAIVASVGPVVGCQKSAIFLVQDDGHTLTPSASRGLSHEYVEQLPEIMRTARGEGPGAGAERQPLIVNDVRIDPRLERFRALTEREGIRAFADVPLQAREQAIGTLAVYYVEPHRFTVAELDLLTTFANQAAVAVSNAKLYARTDEALARRVDELAAIEEIGRELTGTLDFNHVIERVLDAALESAGAHYGLVALYDTDKQALHLVAARGYPLETLADVSMHEWLSGHAIIQAALREGTPISSDDVQNYPAYRALDPSVRSVLVTPILREGHPFGVIKLASRQRARFDDDTSGFINQLATQAAVAIRNAQLYQQSQNRLRETSVLFDMGRRFTTILDLPDLGRELTYQMATALDATHCLLHIVADAYGRLDMMAEYATPGFRPVGRRNDPRSGIEAVPRSSQQPTILYAHDAHPNGPALSFLSGNQVEALIGLPLVAGSELIGHLTWLYSRPRPPFSPDDIRFAQTLANQASIALQNARLFNERARRIADLSHLYQASLALAASIDFDEALERISLIAREITDSDAVTVYLYDSKTDQVTHGTYLAGSERLSDPSSIRPGGVTRRVIETRQPLLVNDTLREPDMNMRVVEAGIRSVIAMPILRKSEVLGVLYVNSRQPSKYNSDSLQLVQLLANEAAVAIDNARLFSEVARARDRLAAILNSSRDGVLMFGEASRIVLANPMLEQIWGIPRERLEGQSLLRLLDSPEFDLAALLGYSPSTLRSLLEQAATGASVHWEKETFILQSARPHSIERTGLPVLDESGGRVGWMLVLRDVTEERELQQMREDLSNMIIHDLRSPLVAILDSYSLIAEGIPPDRTALSSQALDIGQRSTRKLLDLVNSLLDLSRFEHGQMRLDTEFAALRPLADNALEHLAPLANEQGILIRNDIPHELPLVRVEEDQITRVLSNLIDNAVKFSPLGSQVIISARSYVNGEGESSFILCSVRDMGPGVPREYRERIFERFIQLSNGATRRRGTGLGLAFCKLAIEAHGGSIWVEDAPEGPGSQFCFTLPIAVLPPE